MQQNSWNNCGRVLKAIPSVNFQCEILNNLNSAFRQTETSRILPVGWREWARKPSRIVKREASFSTCSVGCSNILQPLC